MNIDDKNSLMEKLTRMMANHGLSEEDFTPEEIEEGLQELMGERNGMVTYDGFSTLCMNRRNKKDLESLIK